VSHGRERGALALVLHTHMPYVEGFGTWPSGEEWLWEAMASCYLPLADLLDEGAPLTLSLTPVLCDQLEAPGVFERFGAFVEGVRAQTHAEDAASVS
jgi:1,4-alpha-glucan branching enzyme